MDSDTISRLPPPAAQVSPSGRMTRASGGPLMMDFTVTSGVTGSINGGSASRTSLGAGEDRFMPLPTGLDFPRDDADDQEHHRNLGQHPGDAVHDGPVIAGVEQDMNSRMAPKEMLFGKKVRASVAAARTMESYCRSPDALVSRMLMQS
ncbi:MAG TPA: hypothetical protein VHY31_12140 [Streptosporangiaceae bacterium]|nr:hypothetical protein [Streptosporangiaceae bacterium]